MKCPNCRKEMVILELDKVEIDHCLLCGGIWLDEGELELLLEGTLERDKLLASFKINKKADEKKRKCPVCGKKMYKVLCDMEKKVLIDSCSKNHGLWFDRGELDQLLEMGGIENKSKFYSFLKDLFGKKVLK